MGNQKLAELRAESISRYFNGVDSINVDIKPDQGPNIYSKTMSKSERDSARIKTAEYRYCKITVKATFEDTLVDTDVLPEEVINKNTYILVKTIDKKSSGGSRIKTKRTKNFRPKIKKFKCNNVGKCPVFGLKKDEQIFKF